MRFHFRRWWPVSAAASFMYVRLVLKVVASFVAASVSCLLSDPPINWVISSPKIATASAAAAADVIGVCIVFVRASLIFSLLCRSVSDFQPLLPPGGTFTPLLALCP